MEILSFGVCKCIREPQGDFGLEGYSNNEKYRFQLMSDSKSKYFRLYPNNDSEYYECCEPGVFRKHFEIITK